MSVYEKIDIPCFPTQVCNHNGHKRRFLENFVFIPEKLTIYCAHSLFDGFVFLKLLALLKYISDYDLELRCSIQNDHKKVITLNNKIIFCHVAFLLIT